MTTLKIRFDDREHEALEALAWRERRKVEAQAAVIVLNELQRLGLLKMDTSIDRPEVLA